MTDDLLTMLAVVGQGLVAQVVGYFTVVGLVFAVVWRWGRERFKGRRIPAPARFDGAQLRRELSYTVLTFLVGTSSVGVVQWLQHTGRASLVTAEVSPLTTVAWVVGLLAFNDLWFYGWHRLLHHPKLFRHVHAVHHRSIDVNPFTSYSFHAFEGFILGVWVVPAAVFLPLPMSALGVVQVVGLANNVMAHLGYEFLPKGLMKVPLLKWTNTATFHSLHHTRSTGNFGLHTRLWDQLFGTEVPDYEEVFVRRGDGA